ncbi:MAG: dihydropteroate synthase [Candidatus Tectomicrobia bacterium]|uniref:Dihydropteroate synthase n=1 Tax=Tectimicrobiota bacterium TaxID=2528274 RepID=A0A933LQX2_UNCTE|nr:dihydropteroate synthase [Candidatus Tectomicrobia bacterium]
MFAVIGERINGMFNDVKKAIQTKDKKIVQDLAIRQTECGAAFLDVNVGPASAEPAEAMAWLIETIQEVCKTPISLDSPRLSVVEAGLKVCKNKALINSTLGDPEKLDKYFPLALQHNASIIALTIDKRGIPGDVNRRVEIAATIIEYAMNYEFPIENLYIDPIVNPVKFSQPQAANVLEAIRQFKMFSDPPPHTVVGLSNLSQGTLHRELINRTFVTMAITAGLDTAILDPMDTEMMDEIISTEILLNKSIYSDSYLEATKKTFKVK